MFKFELNQIAKIKVSGEEGTIIGRADYTDHAPQYQVQYKAADGRATETWWSESALVVAG